MNLYLISQEKNTGYDTYDSAVVCAESSDAAQAMSPSSGSDAYTWCAPKYVTVKLLGKAHKSIERGVICASFNAG